MGQQVNFYMTPQDEQEFLAFLRSDRDVGVFKRAIWSEDIPFLEELPAAPEPFWWSLCLWDRQRYSAPRLRFIKEQGYFIADTIESELIEWSRVQSRRGTTCARSNLGRNEWLAPRGSFCYIQEQRFFSAVVHSSSRLDKTKVV